MRFLNSGVMTSLVVIVLLTPFTVQGIVASVSSRQITHLNYRVTFSPTRKVKLVSDIWSHIFDFHLPDMISSNLDMELPHCEDITTNAYQV